MKYICPCGYEYDPVVGDPESQQPMTKVTGL